MMKFPLLDLKAQYESIEKELKERVSEVLDSQMFILGAEVKALEEELSEYVGAKYALGVSSGSDALIISLMALQVGQGDSVVTTPFTFFATGGAIARLGAKPVFCDIEPNTFNIDTQKLAELLELEIEKKGNAQIKGILPVHLYGQCVDMKPIQSLAEKYDLFVLEDAAQAVGSEYLMDSEVKRACSLGDLGILSFYPAKNLGAYGDAGMVFTENQDLADRMRLLRVHGSSNKYIYDILGGNFRMDAIQAAVLRIKLKHLDSWIVGRQQKATAYDGLFREAGLVERGLIQIPEVVYGDMGLKYFHTFHQYVIRADSRDDLQLYMREKGVPSAIFYPIPLHLQKCFAYLGYSKGDFPESENAASEVLALPIYPELSEKNQEYVVTTIKEFYSDH
jgi:dTDP-4-amino-4,6-dideoxygalactose transaminase